MKKICIFLYFAGFFSWLETKKNCVWPAIITSSSRRPHWFRIHRFMCCVRWWWYNLSVLVQISVPEYFGYGCIELLLIFTFHWPKNIRSCLSIRLDRLILCLFIYGGFFFAAPMFHVCSLRILDTHAAYEFERQSNIKPRQNQPLKLHTHTKWRRKKLKIKIHINILQSVQWNRFFRNSFFAFVQQTTIDGFVTWNLMMAFKFRLHYPRRQNGMGQGNGTVNKNEKWMWKCNDNAQCARIFPVFQRKSKQTQNSLFSWRSWTAWRNNTISKRDARDVDTHTHRKKLCPHISKTTTMR